jgi:ABC-type uncharacterized transport system involved in gliding motility auxiliary subunit
VKKLSAYFGASGLGFLLAGALLRFMEPGRERVAAGFVVAGLVLFAIYLVNHWSEVSAFAGRRSAREGANSLVLMLIVLGIVATVNYIANRHAKRWDLTAARQYTLSDQTTKVLADLEGDVAIVLLDNPASSRAAAARDLLDLYDNESDRVRVSIVDPEREPERALSYQEPGETGIAMGTVLILAPGRKERATAPTEPEITNALLRALRRERKKILFTGGHQEKSLDDPQPDSGLSVMKRKLEASTYDTETLVIARSIENDEMRIPADADALVVAGPKLDFRPEEIAAIDRYLASGGKAVFLIDPERQGDTKALSSYLVEKGIELENDVVVDPLSLPPLYPVVRDYGRHPIVESFSNVVSVFPLVRSVMRSEKAPDGVEVRELFSSEAESWSETRIEELGGKRQGPASDQPQGARTLAVAVTMPVDSAGGGESGESAGSSRLVVVGDSDFITNELASAPVLNADLFLNMVNWVAQDEDLISIRPREPEDRRVFLSRQQIMNVILFSLLILPGVILVIGVSVWWGRR